MKSDETASDLPDGKHYFVMELLDGLPLDALQALNRIHSVRGVEGLA